MKVNITDIQRFCMHDGPGIRTAVFFKGCPLRCIWCHNPETQSFSYEIYYDEKKCLNCMMCEKCGSNAHVFNGRHIFKRENCVMCGKCMEICPSGALSVDSKNVTAEYIMDEVKKDVPFYGQKGGVTLSGGEPMAQPEAALAILRLAKEANINTAIETCGFFDGRYIPELCRYTDTFLWDFKDSINARHIENTGVSNEKILKNLHMADENGANIVLRCILIKGINYSTEHFENVKKLKDSLKNCNKVDFIPYHPMGSSKYRLLGREDTAMKTQCSAKEMIPSKEELEFARKFIQ